MFRPLFVANSFVQRAVFVLGSSGLSTSAALYAQHRHLLCQSHCCTRMPCFAPASPRNALAASIKLTRPTAEPRHRRGIRSLHVACLVRMGSPRCVASIRALRRVFWLPKQLRRAPPPSDVPSAGTSSSLLLPEHVHTHDIGEQKPLAPALTNQARTPLVLCCTYSRYFACRRRWQVAVRSWCFQDRSFAYSMFYAPLLSTSIHLGQLVSAYLSSRRSRDQIPGAPVFISDVTRWHPLAR